MRLYLNVVAAATELAFEQTNGVALPDLLRKDLRCLAFTRVVAKGWTPVILFDETVARAAAVLVVERRWEC